MKGPWKVVLALLLGLPALVGAQPCNSTKGQLAYCNALTDAVMFGFPRYTTALLPTCGTSNKGAVAFDTTAGTYKGCNGSSWSAFGGSGITNSAGANVVMKSDGTNAVASGITDDGTTVTSTENVVVGSAAAGKNVTVNATLGAEIAPSLATGANWTSGSGWTAGDPAGIKGADGTGTLTPASGATVVAGTAYKVTITLSAWSVGSATFTLGGNPAITTATSATTFTYYLTASATTKMVITPTNTSRFTISAISIKAITSTTGNLTAQGPSYFGSPAYFGVGSSATVPGLADLNEPTLGFYRVTAGVWNFTGGLTLASNLVATQTFVGGTGGMYWTGRAKMASPADGVWSMSNNAASTLVQLRATGAPAVAGSCGSSPTVTGQDSALKIAVGTGSPTSCTVTFQGTWTTAPVCVANATATTTPLNVATTTTTVIVSSAALTASEVLHVVCVGF